MEPDPEPKSFYLGSATLGGTTHPPVPEAVDEAEDGQVEGLPLVAPLLATEGEEVEDRSQAALTHQLPATPISPYSAYILQYLATM